MTDLLRLVLLVVGTNVVTYLVARRICWQELKETALLPVQVAILGGYVRDIKISCEVAEEFQPKFIVLQAAVKRYHERKGSGHVVESSSRRHQDSGDES